ncbi:MAG: hypothetical protein EPN93_15130 [Spirochaetes bacterium]|nr:MAG: hypothetical protein EPN93_15130 [Spirochaetota bacterium]
MTAPADLFARLDEGFASRCGDFDLQRAAWVELAGEYPPFLERYREAAGPLPSGIVARRSGDLGLSMLWIVQATIIRALLADLRSAGDADKIAALLDMLEHDRIASLAHSEDAANPVTVERSESNEACVSGTKKYITGGYLCDLVILTMRLAGEQKVSRAAVIPAYIIPDDAFEELHLAALRSMSHTRLTLRKFLIPESDLFAIEGADLRRAIKRWGIVERALIMEAFIAFCMYMGEALPAGAIPNHALDDLQSLLTAQSATTKSAYDQARAGERVDERSADLASVLALAGAIRDAHKKTGDANNEGLAARLQDLDLFSHLRA